MKENIYATATGTSNSYGTIRFKVKVGEINGIDGVNYDTTVNKSYVKPKKEIIKKVVRPLARRAYRLKKINRKKNRQNRKKGRA